MSYQVVMNITANNAANKDDKTRGLIYTDYLVAGSFIILIHGKMITCLNIVDKNQKIQHLCLQSDNNEEVSYYKLDNEPCAIWMMDKSVDDIKQRWKIIIGFKNGHVKELTQGNEGFTL